MSIAGITKSLVEAAKHFQNVIPELHPDDNYLNDPISAFGVLEAQRHRPRGIPLAMFMALMKYYVQSYNDLIELNINDEERRRFYTSFTTRCYDRMEIAYAAEWSANDGSKQIGKLQEQNRTEILKKDKYLTIFESLFVPVIFLNSELKIVDINQTASHLFTDFKVAGSFYITVRVFPFKFFKHFL